MNLLALVKKRRHVSTPSYCLHAMNYIIISFMNVTVYFLSFFFFPKSKTGIHYGEIVQLDPLFFIFREPDTISRNWKLMFPLYIEFTDYLG